MEINSILLESDVQINVMPFVKASRTLGEGRLILASLLLEAVCRLHLFATHQDI